MPVIADERLVKCPTEHCPGWITLDDARPQTVPCRYCRITTHTLAFLLGQIGEREAAAGPLDLWSPRLHEHFNNLMLTLAGAANNNVYIRPMERNLVSRVSGKHGVALEYNPEIAGVSGAGPVVALMLHELLHFDLHRGDERPLQLTFRQGQRDKEFLAGALGHLGPLGDHVWLFKKMDEIDPQLRQSLQAWGFDIALMMSGNESFFLPYISERNRRWLAESMQQLGADGEEMRLQLVERLADLTVRFYGQEREQLRRTVLALQLADLKLSNSSSAEYYGQQLSEREIGGYQDAASTAQRVYEELADVRNSTEGQPNTTDFRRALEGAIRGLGLQSVIEVFGQKTK